MPMNEVLLATLKMCKMTIPAHGPVFRTHHGTPYRLLRTAFEHAVHTAGIADLTFHDWRHTFASRLVMSGIDLPTVQALMGHKDISMTLRYTHLSSDHKQRAVKALECLGNKSQQFPQQRDCNRSMTGHKGLMLRRWAASSTGRATDS